MIIMNMLSLNTKGTNKTHNRD